MIRSPVSGAPAGAQQGARRPRPAATLAPVATRLYIVCSERREDDPLDVIAAAMPALLTRYQDVRWVVPDGDISLRSLRRGLRPGRDSVLFDFTRPSTALWAAETARVSPGAILCGARRLPLKANVDASLRRARRRYSGLLRDFFARGRVAALDVEIPSAGYQLARPSFTIPPAFAPAVTRYTCAVICAADGVEEAYGALRGWQAAREKAIVSGDGTLLISVATTNEVAQVQSYFESLGQAATDMNVELECRTHRADLARIAARSDILVDMDRFSWTGTTEALAAAEAAGIPCLRITSMLPGIAAEFEAVLAAPPAPKTVPMPNTAAFSAALVRFIEAAQIATYGRNIRLGAAV